jgi:hypothetical protein
VSNVPFSIFPAQRFTEWKRRTALLHVSIMWFPCMLGIANLGHRCLHSSRPMDFNNRREASSMAYWRMSWKSGSFTQGDIASGPLPNLSVPTIKLAATNGWRISFQQEIKKRPGSDSWRRYEAYKNCTR